MTASKCQVFLSVSLESLFSASLVFSLEVQARNVLDDQSSFGFLCNRLWENPKELFVGIYVEQGILLKESGI